MLLTAIDRGAVGVVFSAFVLFASTAVLAQAPPGADGCIACHQTQPDRRIAEPAARFAEADVHRERGFACVECHGGDSAATEKTRAHDAGRGFRGKPAGPALIDTCARCHSDPVLMRRFAPRQRVDQAAEYATSVHGQRLAKGDRKVATCVSCHAAHGVRRVNDARSPVFATNVAATCASCHADSTHMAGYTTADGSPLPTRQRADYETSVHYTALTKGNDLSAPTCNDCHGNHGAAPPGVGAVVNVCGTCHASFAQKFATSVHQQIFDKGCVECHSNHAILQPSDAMLSAASPGVCAPCHNAQDRTDNGAAAAETMRGGIEQLKASLDRSQGLIAQIKNAGIEVSDQELALREARTTLTVARTAMHAFDPAAVGPILARGTTIVEAVDRAGQNGVAELRYRRRGLFVSLGAILLVVVALALKVRQIDRRQASRD